MEQLFPSSPYDAQKNLLDALHWVILKLKQKHPKPFQCIVSDHYTHFCPAVMLNSFTICYKISATSFCYVNEASRALIDPRSCDQLNLNTRRKLLQLSSRHLNLWPNGWTSPSSSKSLLWSTLQLTCFITFPCRCL